MRRRVFAVIAAAVAAGLTASRALAITPASPGELAAAAWTGGHAQNIGFDCRCERNWGPREYWRWDHRPIWDDPWRVLKPNFWGSPEPHLVPADIWACKWHLPSARLWRRHRRQCPAWE
jgi:hypothetical protein